MIKPFRVLSLDGGGMRGTYAATYLDRLAHDFAQRRSVERLDLGRAFDLIVGTSTGAIIACAVAADVPLGHVVRLYQNHGPDIFRRRLPAGLAGVLPDLVWRRSALRRGEASLRAALEGVLKGTTMGELYARRGIALAIPAVELSQHNSWVFKTSHLPTSNCRDDGYSLVDVCMAASAAPLYRSLAAVKRPKSEGRNVFADGGLWANNPVLVALTEALDMAAPGQPIHIYCLGTCPRPEGEQLGERQLHRGLLEWKFGGAAATLAIDAQEFAYDHMALKLARHLGRTCEVVRMPRGKTPASLLPFLEIDDARTEAIDALINQAHSDADHASSLCSRPDDAQGRLICELFSAAPGVPAHPCELEFDAAVRADASARQAPS